MKATGHNGEAYRRVFWDASEYMGKELYIQVVDKHTGGWGHINVDDVNVPVHIEAALEEEKDPNPDETEPPAGETPNPDETEPPTGETPDTGETESPTEETPDTGGTEPPVGETPDTGETESPVEEITNPKEKEVQVEETPKSEEKESKKENILPETATNNHFILFIGIILLLIGGGIIKMKKFITQ